MELQKFSLYDDEFVRADILTSAGTIQICAQIFPGGMPAHIDSITWLDTGADASMDMSERLDDLRQIVQKEAEKALA